MVEAYLFFYDELSDYFLGTDSEPPLGAEYELGNRLEECFQALKNALHVVAIDLDKDDDPQVIFETLNARGEPLLPADLLRNFIFLRVAREGKSQEELYKTYWERFDDEFWRKEIRQGRLIRPRSDLFMQHFLASRQARDIAIKHLYVEYKDWLDKKKPFASIGEELETLARQRDDFRKILDPDKDHFLYPFIRFLNSFDNTTVYPLLLFLMDSKMSEEDLQSTVAIVESYLLRRAICGYTAKSYNRIFLTLIRLLRDKGVSVQTIENYFSALEGESTKWPEDATFVKTWQTHQLYETLNNERLVYIMKRLNDALHSSKNESIAIDGSLTVEHILPQTWIENWPLSDGTKGMTYEELEDAPPDDKRAEATRLRDALLQTIGNLTMLTQPLNSSVSNSDWNVKKPALLKLSLLPINQHLLHDAEKWDEEAIIRRSKTLFDHAKTIWKGPSSVREKAGAAK